MLIAAELAPGGMEFAGHSQHFHAQATAVGCGHREMVIAPAAGGQAFQLQMGIGISQIPAANDDMATIVEHGQAGLHGIHSFPHPGGIIGIDLPAQLSDILRVIGIPAAAQHCLHTMGAVALPLSYDVQENAVGIVVFADFLDLGQKIVQVGGIHAQQAVAGCQRITLKAAIRPALHTLPFGVLGTGLFVEAGGKVHRCLHADLVGGLDLGSQQVKIQMGMGFVGLAGMVGPAMVALGEHRNGRHMAKLQHFLKLCLGKFAADTGNMLRGMEIQMDLPE